MEQELMPFNGESVFFAHGAIQTGIRLDLVQIKDAAAAITNEMGVRGGGGIKTFLPLNHAHADDRTVLPEEIQIAVDRPQTQIGVCGL